MRTPDTLSALVDHGIIDQVLRPLMSGKEAHIYLVESGGEQRVAKIYKEANNRSFQNRADYTEGRKVRNSRDQRAMGSRSKHGRAQNEAAWKSAEVDMIYRLRDAGVRVPVPYHFIDGVLIMELVTDADGFPAPRLGDLTLEPEEATEVFNKVLAEVVRMLCAGVVHGDLSDFNVLMSADGPVVIDFPQAVDASSNANARKLLLRDVDNLHRFHAKFAPQIEALPYAQEMWDLYSRNALTPDARLTGKFRTKQKAVSTADVLELIADADHDERRRREGLGLAMRGTAAPRERSFDNPQKAGPAGRGERAPQRDVPAGQARFQRPERAHGGAAQPDPRGPRPERQPGAGQARFERSASVRGAEPARAQSPERSQPADRFPSADRSQSAGRTQSADRFVSADRSQSGHGARSPHHERVPTAHDGRAPRPERPQAERQPSARTDGADQARYPTTERGAQPRDERPAARWPTARAERPESRHVAPQRSEASFRRDQGRASPDRASPSEQARENARPQHSAARGERMDSRQAAAPQHGGHRRDLNPSSRPAASAAGWGQRDERALSPRSAGQDAQRRDPRLARRDERPVGRADQRQPAPHDERPSVRGEQHHQRGSQASSDLLQKEPSRDLNRSLRSPPPDGPLTHEEPTSDRFSRRPRGR
ncbi:MAG: hypothetical protein JWN48_3078 [Myxococcaceae bacterium]|nr:hypothetical protein [Myxococcaceae bacterium]